MRENHERAITGSIALPVSDYVYRTVRLPNDFNLLIAFTGALVAMGKSEYWQQVDGTNTPEETALMMRDLLDTMTEGGAMSRHIGEIIAYAGNTTPSNCLLCDGASYLRSDYPDLFAEIATTFGAMDGTHFNVPDLRGRSILGSGQGVGLSNRILGQGFGAEQHTLTETEMPVHNHTVPRVSSNTATSTGLLRRTDGSSPGNQNTSNDGGGLPHNNMHPFLVLNYAIVYQAS